MEKNMEKVFLVWWKTRLDDQTLKRFKFVPMTLQKLINVFFFVGY